MPLQSEPGQTLNCTVATWVDRSRTRRRRVRRRLVGRCCGCGCSCGCRRGIEASLLTKHRGGSARERRIGPGSRRRGPPSGPPAVGWVGSVTHVAYASEKGEPDMAGTLELAARHPTTAATGRAGSHSLTRTIFPSLPAGGEPLVGLGRPGHGEGLGHRHGDRRPRPAGARRAPRPPGPPPPSRPRFGPAASTRRMVAAPPSGPAG